MPDELEGDEQYLEIIEIPSGMLVVEETHREVIGVGLLGPQGPPGPAGDPSAFTREVPLGPINGINTTFSTSHDFIAETPILYLNGLALEAGYDFSEQGTSELVMDYAPEAGDRLVVTYVRSV